MSDNANRYSSKKYQAYLHAIHASLAGRCTPAEVDHAWYAYAKEQDLLTQPRQA